MNSSFRPPPIDYQNATENGCVLVKGCTIDQQQRLQRVLFPEGITYDMKTGYGTTTTCMLFNLLREDLEGKGGLVALTGIEPVSQP